MQNMRFVRIVTLISGLAATLGVAHAGGPFRDLSFDDALKEAKKSDKVLFVDFFTTWCRPCKMLDRTTWKDEKVVKLLNEKTVAIKIDADKQKPLAKKYGVSGYPTLMFFKADGTRIGSLVGYLDGPTFLKSAKDMVAGITPLDRMKEDLEKSPNDPMKRHQFGQMLANEGKYDEALKEFLWCFDNGAGTPGYNGVRSSFLLAYIRQLGSVHTPAMKALEERRDAAEKKVREGANDFQSVNDVIAINRVLDGKDRVIALYDELQKIGNEDNNSLSILRGALFEDLLQAKRYDELARDDLVNQYTDSLSSLALITQQYKDDPRDPSARMKRRTLYEGAMYTEAAAGAGKTDAAITIAKKALSVESSTTTHQMLTEAAERAGNAEYSKQLAALLEETPKSS